MNEHSSSSNRDKGQQAEQQVAEYLNQQGYRIFEKNYHTRYGELDLIAQDGDCLVFIEVKQRSTSRFGTAEDAVTPSKQRKLTLAAQHFLQENAWDGNIRFDVVAINQGELNHYQHAFESDESAQP